MPYKNKEKQREYARRYVAKRRADFFAGKRCAVWWCGSTVGLELDHIDPKQKVSHNIWSWSQERRDAELAKCQVLCEPCHKDKTNKDRGGPRHGTDAMYGKGKCRCNKCKEARSVAKKANRQRRISLGLPRD